MPTLPEPKREQSSTYIVQDRSNQDELSRLQTLDRMLTAGMGGILSEQPDLTRFHSILDVGCGTGGWLIELAKTLPDSKILIGVDASLTLIEYARTQAEAAQVADRVEFHVADALRMLEFPDHFFDLVNHRAAASWLRTWDWPKLLQEYLRVCRDGGIVRITESESMATTNSPALSRLSKLFVQAFYQAGHLFTPTREGITGELAHLLQQHGLQQVQTKTYSITNRADTLEGQRLFENNKLGYRIILPFLKKWTSVPDNYEELYQQMLSEMQQPDFEVTTGLLTAWGIALPQE
ncbi:MAG TPA: class I SAM-dependent methyltransferase [Ktedonobacteraceae bacterium]